MELLNHIYWKQKGQFALASDCYNSWVAFAVEEGVFKYEIGQHSGSASFGDLVVCPPGVTFHRETVTPLTFHYIQFNCNEEETLRLVLSAGKFHINDTKRLSSNYAYLRQSSEDSGPLIQDWKTHLIADLWLLHQLESRMEVVRERKFTEDALMAEAAALLEQHAGTSLSLQNIARSLALSPVQLTRRFQEAFQETPSQYLKSIRLKRAKKLLQDSELNLTQIAERCGYENGFYLSRVFSKTMGMSPTEYRKRHRV